MQASLQHTQQMLQGSVLTHLHVNSFLQVFLEHTAGATGLFFAHLMSVH